MIAGLLDTIADFTGEAYSVAVPERAGPYRLDFVDRQGTSNRSAIDHLLFQGQDLGVSIAFPILGFRWQATRYSDSLLFGAWYGAAEMETALAESVHHWVRFVEHAFPENQAEIRSKRTLYRVKVDSILVDLRDKHIEFPQLLDPRFYGFTQRVGEHLYRRRMNGVLVKSTDIVDGTSVVILNPEAFSDVVEVCNLTYRHIPGGRKVLVERSDAPGETLEIYASAPKYFV